MCAPADTVIQLTEPTQRDAEDMGIRDWPPTTVRVSFDEQCAEGALRYVLEGSGMVTCAGESFSVSLNSLVRVQADDTSLFWSVDDECQEMVLLTPEYRGPPLLPVVGAFVLLCAALVATTVA